MKHAIKGPRPFAGRKDRRRYHPGKGHGRGFPEEEGTERFGRWHGSDPEARKSISTATVGGGGRSHLSPNLIRPEPACELMLRIRPTAPARTSGSPSQLEVALVVPVFKRSGLSCGDSGACGKVRVDCRELLWRGPKDSLADTGGLWVVSVEQTGGAGPNVLVTLSSRVPGLGCGVTGPGMSSRSDGRTG